MRITAEVTPSHSASSGPEEIALHLDREGLEYLTRLLDQLKERGDHVHLMTPSWGMDDLSEEKSNPENSLAHHLRVTLV